MSKTRSHSSSNNSSRKSQRTHLPKAANEATGHPSPSQPTPPAAASPANREQTNTANQAAEDNRQAYRQHHGSQRKSSKADVPPANAYDVDLQNHKASFCPKYSRGGNPPQQDQTLAPNRNEGHQIKRQKSFDNQQPKNS